MSELKSVFEGQMDSLTRRMREELRAEMAALRAINASQRDQIAELCEEMTIYRSQMETQFAPGPNNQSRKIPDFVPVAMAVPDSVPVALAVPDPFLEELVSVDFGSLSSPGTTTVVRGPTSTTLTYPYPNPSQNQFGICSIPLSRVRPARWQVELLSLPDGGWVFLGVIGTPQPPYPLYFSHPTSFCWESGYEVRVGGARQKGLGGWEGMRQGDVMEFSYSPIAATLSLLLRRGSQDPKAFSIPTPGLGEGAYITFFFRYPGTSVRFSRIG